MSDIHQIESVFLLLLLFLVGFGTLAQRLKIAYPIVLVIGGLAISVIPGLPRVSLSPDLVFLVLLPPLLFSAAYNTSWRDFRRNLSTIFSLAFALVAFTTVGVGLAAHWLLPGFDWRLGLVLGAVLSPTDAIAATSIAKRLQLPGKITDILEAESLVNDGSGLLALEFAVAIVVGGQTPTIVEGIGRLLYLVIGGIAVGLVLGKLVYFFETWVEDAPIEVTVSLVAPYLAYLGGEAVHASGILSVVACGLFLGRRSSIYLSSNARMQASATWNTLTFLLNGLAFLLIGLQLPYVRQSIKSVGTGQLLFSAAVVVFAVIVLRLAWVFARQYVSRRLVRRVLKRPDPSVSARGVFITGWTGMRGVVSLAAAISLPETVASGAPFPQRNVIIFLTFCVIFVTLVLQGLTLPFLIRRLGFARTDEGTGEEERDARRQILRSALQELERLRSGETSDSDSVYNDLAQHYKARLAAFDPAAKPEGASSEVEDYFLYRSLSRQLREVERATAVELRDSNKISDEILRKVERELDLLDTRYPKRR